MYYYKYFLQDGVFECDLCPTHRAMVTSSTSNQIRIWDYSNGLQAPKIIQEFAGHSGSVNDIALLQVLFIIFRMILI